MIDYKKIKNHRKVVKRSEIGEKYMKIICILTIYILHKNCVKSIKNNWYANVLLTVDKY